MGRVRVTKKFIQEREVQKKVKLKKTPINGWVLFKEPFYVKYTYTGYVKKRPSEITYLKVISKDDLGDDHPHVQTDHPGSLAFMCYIELYNYGRIISKEVYDLKIGVSEL